MNRDTDDAGVMDAGATSKEKYKCPVCEYYTLDSFYGSYDVYPVCFWEENGIQFEDPLVWGGANSESLILARVN